MKKLLITSILLLSASQSTLADEKYNHFPSLKSEDINTALCNIKNYNEKLAVITSKTELSAEDMVKVHELTYTLENAVNFLRETLKQVSVDLEEVHKASERLEPKIIKSAGESYLSPTTTLVMSEKC